MFPLPAIKFCKETILLKKTELEVDEVYFMHQSEVWRTQRLKETAVHNPRCILALFSNKSETLSKALGSSQHFIKIISKLQSKTIVPHLWNDYRNVGESQTKNITPYNKVFKYKYEL